MNASSNDPTMSTNAGLEQKGKLLPWRIEHVLRDIEENNFDRRSFNAQKQLWEKNMCMYGESGSDKRKTYIRFVSNVVKRHSWKNYADLLMEYGVEMSKTTEEALALEMENEEEASQKDEEIQDHEMVTTKESTLNPTFASDSDPLVDDLANSFASAISGLGSTPVHTFGSPFRLSQSGSGGSVSGFSSQASQAQPTYHPSIAQRLSFDHQTPHPVWR